MVNSVYWNLNDTQARKVVAMRWEIIAASVDTRILTGWSSLSLPVIELLTHCKFVRLFVSREMLPYVQQRECIILLSVLLLLAGKRVMIDWFGDFSVISIPGLDGVLECEELLPALLVTFNNLSFYMVTSSVILQQQMQLADCELLFFSSRCLCLLWGCRFLPYSFLYRELSLSLSHTHSLSLSLPFSLALLPFLYPIVLPSAYFISPFLFPWCRPQSLTILSPSPVSYCCCCSEPVQLCSVFTLPLSILIPLHTQYICGRLFVKF